MTPQTMFRKPPIFGAKNIKNAMVSCLFALKHPSTHEFPVERTSRTVRPHSDQQMQRARAMCDQHIL
jgi:hypothetical protein